jgi:hypothetical protein
MEILKSLVHEKEKVVRLNEKIDHLCLVRMRELPIAVQKGKIYLYILYLITSASVESLKGKYIHFCQIATKLNHCFS